MGHKLKTIKRYWHTMRHLRPSQIGWRLRYRLRSAPKTAVVPDVVPTLDLAACARLAGFLDHWAAEAPPEEEATDAFLRRRYTFLNKTILARTPPWQNVDVSKLWAYQLHYFDYGRDIALRHGDREGEGARQIREWTDDWIEKNQPGQPVAWEAYPLSVRLMNWSVFVARYGWCDVPLLRSMHGQLNYLAGRLEYDICGNHLLKNAAAMTLAGTILNSPHGADGLALLEREVAAQMLPDGGHFERSPMYHGQVLLDLVMAASVLDPVPAWLAHAIEKGLDFLRGVQHGDGCLAQFNDGAVYEGVGPHTVATMASFVGTDKGTPASGGSQAFPDSGLYRLEGPNGGGTMIVKAGRSMADYQPGHAHSDLMSFEYSLGGAPIFVNAGTHGYAESPYRDYCRSAGAHNTVSVNGQDQHEHWSTFRVARRIHGSVLAWDVTVPALRATCAQLQGARHERQVDYSPHEFWRVIDRVTDRGAIQTQSALHLHPDATLEEMPTVDGHRVFRVRRGARLLLLVAFNFDSLRRLENDTANGPGLYFPCFGQALPTSTLHATAQGTGTVETGFAIAPLSDDASEEGLVRAMVDGWNTRQSAP